LGQEFRARLVWLRETDEHFHETDRDRFFHIGIVSKSGSDGLGNRASFRELFSILGSTPA
jgi:hypothetical protein